MMTGEEYAQSAEFMLGRATAMAHGAEAYSGAVEIAQSKAQTAAAFAIIAGQMREMAIWKGFRWPTPPVPTPPEPEKHS